MAVTTFAPNPPDGLALSHSPTIKGKVAAHQWIVEAAGVAMSWNFFKNQAKKNSIPHTWIGHAMHFSTHDLWTWLTSQHRQPTPTTSTRWYEQS
ncbi:hypothetical protein [Mycobacterium neglectum]|uniref:hypothetical protein n=1 Tax=Mycobacterium neglectum TaxID=242737 RepID=UPI0011452F31|nr:hypothetical protein [Mycobacterium neglectum]